MNAMNVVDLGRQMVKDEYGARFETYVTEFNAPCRWCGEVLTGRSVVDAALLEHVVTRASADRFLQAETDAYARLFRAELEQHERRHIFRRALAWLVEAWS